MSRSNPQSRLINPSKRFFKWSDGQFVFYDKEKKENVKISLPFSFMVLDELSCVRGYNAHSEASYYSNEVRDVNKDMITVRLQKEVIVSGMYNEFMQTKVAKDMKFSLSVYIAYKMGKEIEICNIQLMGAALGAWFEFKKKNDPYTGAIKVDDYTKGTHGKTEFTIPVFKKIDASEASDTKAKELDGVLQEYLSQYLAKGQQQETDVKEEPQENPQQGDKVVEQPQKSYPDNATGPDDDDLPF